MKHKVFHIRSDKVEGGVKIRAFGRTPRGTKFVVGRVVVVREGLTNKEFQSAKAGAIELLLAGNQPER